MKGFKAIISADIDRVFANTEEFFEVMSVDGRDMRIMLDSDSLNETKLQATAKTAMTGYMRRISLPISRQRIMGLNQKSASL